MRTVSKDVSTEGNVIGKVDVPHCDTVEECVTLHGASEVVTMVNAQHTADVTNKYRQSQKLADPAVKAGREAAKKAKSDPEFAELLRQHGIQI